MNILRKKLESLCPGTHIRIIKQNGDALDGIVLKNDGTESLSLSVSFTAFLSYDGIAGIETSDNDTPLPAVTVTKTAALFPPENPVDIQKIYSTVTSLRSAYALLSKEQQNAATSIYNKYQSYQSSKDHDKLCELIEQSWELMYSRKWEYNVPYNRFHAYLLLTNKDFKDAADSFCYANEAINAARTTYYGAVESQNDELYDTAGAAAVLVLLDENASDFYNEAAEILKQSAAKRMDISFVPRIRKSGTIIAKQYISGILWYLCGCCKITLSDPDNIDESIEKLRIYYRKSGISDEICHILQETDELDISIGENDEDENTSNPTHAKNPITQKTLEGWVTEFQNSGKGLLRGSGNKTYSFCENDIKDTKLLAKLRLFAGKTFAGIPSEFVVVENKDGSEVVTSVKMITPNLSENISSRIHKLKQAQNYTEIIPIGKELLNKGDIDNGCYYILDAYLGLLRQNPEDEATLNAMRTFIETYRKCMTENYKNLDLHRMVYRKLGMADEELQVLNQLISLTPANEYMRLLSYHPYKAEYFVRMEKYEYAIKEWEECYKILTKHPVSSSNMTLSSCLMKIAELYLLMEDWEKAGQYAERLSPDQKKKILDQIAELNLIPESEDKAGETIDTSAKSETVETVDASTNSDTSETVDSDKTEGLTDQAETVITPQQEISLSEYYEIYRGDETFRLTQNDTDIFSEIADFPTDRPYALLTWLTVLSDIEEKTTDSCRNSQISMKYTAAETVSAVEKLFSAAFRNPLTYRKDFGADLPEILECAKKCIPDIADGLFAAASMRALFHYSEDVNIYQYEKLSELIADNAKLNEQFPQLYELFETMLDFRNQTGCGLNFFAKYRTSHDALAQSVAEAQKCLDEILTRLKIYESMPRVRRIREILFGKPENVLRVGLAIVCENRIPEAPKLKKMISEHFLRAGRSFDFSNIDQKKIDSLIDDAWEEALHIIKSQGHSVQNPNDSLIGGRRSNILSSLERILSCLINWVDAAEKSAESENFYAKNLFDEIMPKMEQSLNTIIGSCTASGNWGNEAIRSVAAELLAKLDGSFNTTVQKYFFVDFLRDGNVLLDENFMPDLNSTFCDLPAFTLPQRIRRHALSNLLSFEERLDELFSEDASQNNLRSAQLIRDYGRIIGNSALSDYDMFQKLDKCLRSGRKRLEIQFEDFRDELALCVQYGSLSDVGGEKTRILQKISTWYNICNCTGEFGFYINILDAYRDKVSEAAQKHGQELISQLEDLENDQYDFGVYPPESIRSYIEDRNFTVAENMLNCIRRHDVAAISDYTKEPFGYLSGFINEAAINHRAVSDMSCSLELSLLKHTQKKDLEKALRQFTNTAMKDIKGGISLINSWISRNTTPEKVTKLLDLLGMPGCTLKKDENSKREIYFAKRPLRTGKVIYEHPIPAFGSIAEQEDFRVLCLYGSFDCVRLLDAFKEVNTTAKHTLVLLDFPLNLEERRKLARKLKEEKTFAKTFLVIDRVLLFYLARHYAANTVNRMLMAAAMPFTYYQPFVEKSSDNMPPELFTGREEALVSIEQPSGANLVFGGRQLGKSALLKMAKHNIDGNADGARAVIVEIKSLNYTDAAREVSYRLIVEGILPEGSETDNWETLTRNIEQRLRSSIPTKIGYLLLMLDEADTFILSCQEVGHRPIALLKNLMPGQFKIVMAGLHTLSRFNRDIALHGNSLFAHLSSINVKPFERPEAVKLLTNTLAYLGLRFKDESVISLILAKTNYFPGIIQLFCLKLLEAMRNIDYAGYREFETPPYEITQSHFEKVLADENFMAEINNKLEMTLFVEEKGHSHYHIIALLIAYLCLKQPNENGYTLEEILQLAKNDDIKRITSLKPEQLRELLDEMWDLNILTSKDNRYSFATKGFREMLGDPLAIREKIDEYFAEGLS